MINVLNSFILFFALIGFSKAEIPDHLLNPNETFEDFWRPFQEYIYVIKSKSIITEHSPNTVEYFYQTYDSKARRLFFQINRYSNGHNHLVEELIVTTKGPEAVVRFRIERTGNNLQASKNSDLIDFSFPLPEDSETFRFSVLNLQLDFYLKRNQNGYEYVIRDFNNQGQFKIQEFQNENGIQRIFSSAPSNSDKYPISAFAPTRGGILYFFRNSPQQVTPIKFLNELEGIKEFLEQASKESLKAFYSQAFWPKL